MYYVVSMVILMVTLFWALVGRGIRTTAVEGLSTRVEGPLHRFPEERAVEFGAISKGRRAESEYQKLEQADKDAYETAKPRRDEMQKQITDLSAKILAVQNVFTDRRAYVNSLTYKLETETSASGKKSKQERHRRIQERDRPRSSFRTGTKAIRLPRTGRELQRP